MNQINNFCETLLCFPCSILSCFVNGIGYLGQRTVYWIRQCLGRDTRINSIRDQNLLNTSTATLFNDTLATANISPRTPLNITIPATEAQTILTTELQEDAPEWRVLRLEDVELILQKDLAFDENIFNAVRGFLNFLANESPYQDIESDENDIIDDDSTDDDEIQDNEAYKPFHTEISKYAENPLTLQYLDACLNVLLPENINDIAEHVTDHFLYNEDLNCVHFVQVILAICKHANHQSIGMFFAACFLGNIASIKENIEFLEKNVNGIYYPNANSLCALNHAKPEVLKQLEQEGLITEEMRDMYWKYLFENLEQNCNRLFSGISQGEDKPSIHPICSAHEVFNGRGIQAAGPKLDTVNAFWEMIQKENVDLIVQLDSLDCCCYYPLMTMTSYGATSITLISKKVFQVSDIHFIHRSLEINNHTVVNHIEIQSWVDGRSITLPALSYLIDNILQSKKFLAHCHKGNGRAGTLVAACMIKDHYSRSQKFFHPVSVVEKLRTERPRAVLTKKQFSSLIEFNKTCFPNPHKDFATHL